MLPHGDGHSAGVAATAFSCNGIGVSYGTEQAAG